MDEKSLSHTSWNCKYHIVLVPKYRRKVIYGKLRKDIGKILRTLCDYKHVEIIEAHAMPDHIHACVDTAQTCRSRFHGVSQREEYAHDIRATCKPKIQIRKESVLGERILRKYSRWK